MPDVARVVRAAMELRGGQPEMWVEFVMSMREYAASMNVEMLRAAPEMLQKAQGMALMANEISTVLNDAPKIFDKMQNTILGRDHAN
jgi:hypothetical protein